MFPPIQCTNFHAAFWASRRSVIFQQGSHCFLNFFCVFITKTSFFRQLTIDAALCQIQTKCNPMLHTHGIRCSFCCIFTIDTLYNLHADNIHWTHTLCNADGNRTSYANRNCIFLKSKYLSKTSNIKPLFTRNSCKFILVSIFSIFNCIQLFAALCSCFQTLIAIHTMVIRLDKNRFIHINQSIPNLPLQTNIRNFSIAVIVFSWTVSTQRVTIWVCIFYGN